MDCVRTALRHGAAKVAPTAGMKPAHAGLEKEVKNAKEEGAALSLTFSPWS